MAGAGKKDDEDNILAHLLPVRAGAVSPLGFVEEDEEEVNYSETDEDLQSVDVPGRGRREATLGGQLQEERSSAGAGPAPSERKHVPISWDNWQGPGEKPRKDGLPSRSSAGRAAGESGIERRRPQDSAAGTKESSREDRERRSRRSPARSRGRETAREWRERILREGTGERAAAPERRRSGDGSKQRSEPGSRRNSEDGLQKAKSRSRDADPEQAAKTRPLRRKRSNPRIGPPGTRELEETEEEGELRRARKKASMWDVDRHVAAGADGRAGPADADARVPRQRSRTPPGPPRLPSPPRAYDHPLSPRRGRRSISPPPRRVAVSLDHLGPPRRLGSPLTRDHPLQLWPGRGARSPPHSWHPTDRSRSPPRDWPPPPPRYFGSPPPCYDALRPPPLEPRHPRAWESDAAVRHHSGPLERPPPLQHHLARGGHDRSGSPGMERRVVAPGPGWSPRGSPLAHPHPSSPSFRRRSSPPRRSRAEAAHSVSPAFIDARLRLSERKQRHSSRSPQSTSGERKPGSRVLASRSSRLQVSSIKEPALPLEQKEASAGHSDKTRDSRTRAAADQSGGARSRDGRRESRAEHSSLEALGAGVASDKEVSAKTATQKDHAGENGMEASASARDVARSDKPSSSGEARNSQTERASDAGPAEQDAAPPGSAQEAGAKQLSDEGEAAPVAPTGTWGRYSATVGKSAADSHSRRDSAQAEQAPNAATGSGDKGSRNSKAAADPHRAKVSQASKDAARVKRESSHQTSAKAGDGREQKSSGAKRAREEMHDSRRPELPSKRHAKATGADHDPVRRGGRTSANGNGQAPDRIVEVVLGNVPPPPELPLPGPPPLPLSALDRSAGPCDPVPSVRDEHSVEWLYRDPKGRTQGPCSIAHFKKWLGTMRVQATLRREYEEFMSCMVWQKDDASTQIPLKKLLQG